MKRGGFKYVLEDFDLLIEDLTPDDLPLLGTKSTEYCPLTVDEAKAQLPGKPEQFLSNTCLLGEYVQIVLGDRGLGPFGSNVKVTSKVKGVSAEWTLGACVVHQHEKLSGVESDGTSATVVEKFATRDPSWRGTQYYVSYLSCYVSCSMFYHVLLVSIKHFKTFWNKTAFNYLC